MDREWEDRSQGKKARTVDLGFWRLSTWQLRALLQEETGLECILRRDRKFQTLQLEQEMRRASNCTLAKQNLALQPRLENGKASLAIKYQELRELRETCQDKQQRLAACMDKWTPCDALSQLQADLDRAEATAGEQLEQFLCRDIPTEIFLESFLNCRLLFHLRHTRVEKLQEILLSEERDPPGELRPDKSPSPELPLLPQNGTAARVFQLRHNFTTARHIPSANVIPFPVPDVPPKHHLPPLGSSVIYPNSSYMEPQRWRVGYVPLCMPHSFQPPYVPPRLQRKWKP